MNNETEDQTRLRRAKEAMASCQSAENEARKSLALAVESTKRSREKYEELFLAEEKREVFRRTTQLASTRA
jgi:hypothetical protein